MENNLKDKVKEYMYKFINNPNEDNYEKLNIYLKKYYKQLNKTKS